MTWYAIYDKTTGELYSTGTVIEPDNLPEHLEYKVLSEAVDFSIQKWDSVNKIFVSKEPEIRRKIFEERLADLETKIDSFIEVKK